MDSDNHCLFDVFIYGLVRGGMVKTTQLSLFDRQKTAVTVTVIATGEKVTVFYAMPRKQIEALCEYFDNRFPEYRHEVSE